MVLKIVARGHFVLIEVLKFALKVYRKVVNVFNGKITICCLVFSLGKIVRGSELARIGT